jgi:hypothetical protein
MAQQPSSNPKWVLPRSGYTPEIYANFAHPSWTLFDVRIRLGRLVSADPTDPTTKDFVVEEVGAVTFSWPQAKNLRDMLTQLVDAFEETNGEIKPLKLPPAKS